MKVAIFQEIIAPYRVPVFNLMHQKGEVDFKVFFLSETQNERLWPVPKDELKFPYEVLPGFRWEGRNLRALHFNSGVLSRLLKNNFDIIVTGGWHQPSYYLSLFYAKLFRKKFLLWSESHAGDLRISNFFNDFLRRMFVRLSSGAIVPGKASKDYLIALGAKPDRIWIAPNAIDTDFYKSKSLALYAHKSEMKHKKNLPTQNILFVGRLIREKGIHDLLQVYAKLNKINPDLGLIICGEGSDRAELETFCQKHHLKNVLFTGFLNREDLIPYYILADVLALPSRTEPWGLVVNEAMTCGLPIICSSKVGAAQDLVRQGENGFIYEPGDEHEIFIRLSWLLSQPEERQRFGEASKRNIQGYSPTHCAEGFLTALRES